MNKIYIISLTLIFSFKLFSAQQMSREALKAFNMFDIIMQNNLSLYEKPNKINCIIKNNISITNEKFLISKLNQNTFWIWNQSNSEIRKDYQNYQDDRYLRLKVANRNRWAMIDDYGYWNDPRYNYAYYPSYLGWNSWYTGYYGASWYNPFGYSMSFGWGGYSPFMHSYYSLGWGFNDFGFGYGGFGGFGYGGFGYGGFGGYGGWNPYYAGYWNPYGSYYYGGGYGGIYYGGIGRPHNPQTRAMQTSGAGLAAYSNNRVYNNTSNNRVNTTNGNVRYTGNPELNNRFGNLVRRVITNNSNPNQANSFDRPSRTFNNGGFISSNQHQVTSNAPASSSSNSSSNSRPTLSSSAGGNSGGFNSSGSSTGGGRAPRTRN